MISLRPLRILTPLVVAAALVSTRAGAGEGMVAGAGSCDLVGIMTGGGESRFALRAPGLAQGVWLRLGETRAGYTVADYWPDLETVAVRTAAGEFLLALPTARVREESCSEGGPGDSVAAPQPEPLAPAEYARRAAEAAREREIRRRDTEA